MTFDDVSRDRETQSQAIRCSRFIPGRLSEGVENMRKKLCRDTAPVSLTVSPPVIGRSSDEIPSQAVNLFIWV